jgi:hypothetical protein
MKTPLCRTFWVLLAASVLGGCNSFGDAYKAAASTPQPPGAITGAWEGTWQSDESGHNGRLRAIVRRIGRDAYNVRYKAGYKMMGVPMSFEHETTLRGHFAGSTFHFKGAADLGWLPGIYRYTGYATPEDFYSTYKSKHDEGTYALRRPVAEPESGRGSRGDSQELWPGSSAPTERLEAAGGSDDFHNLAIEALSPPGAQGSSEQE